MESAAWVAIELQERFPELQVVHPATPKTLVLELRDAEVAIGSTLPPLELAPRRAVEMGATRRLPPCTSSWCPSSSPVPALLTNGGPRRLRRNGSRACDRAHLSLGSQLPHVSAFRRSGFGTAVALEFPNSTQDRAGATLGLVGLGAIGSAVARMAKALDIDFIAVRQHPREDGPKRERRLWPSPKSTKS